MTPDAVLVTDGLSLIATAGFFVPAAILVGGALSRGPAPRDPR